MTDNKLSATFQMSTECYSRMKDDYTWYINKIENNFNKDTKNFWIYIKKSFSKLMFYKDKKEWIILYIKFICKIVENVKKSNLGKHKIAVRNKML